MNKKTAYAAFAAIVMALWAFTGGCGEDNGIIDHPQLHYLEQTFSLLVNDGNAQVKGGDDAKAWDHDGAAVCTLDWNGDGAGPNRVPVQYIYNYTPTVDGRATKDDPATGYKGDKALWDATPWTVIPTAPMSGVGSGIAEVKVKALYTYVNPPRIWFMFQWEDPSHTISGNNAANNPTRGEDFAGIMQYHWHNAPGFDNGTGFESGRDWQSHEDWLALVWSTWWAYNTDNKGKDKSGHRQADLTDKAGHWTFVETVPGFQQNGVGICTGSGNTAYKTPHVATNDRNSPYYDKFYPGPACDLWFWSASRTNYTATGKWYDDDAAFLFDCYFSEGGFPKPPVGSNGNDNSLVENFIFDDGISGYYPNPTGPPPQGVKGTPGNMAPDDPASNPPGAPYIWGSDLTAPAFAGYLPGWQDNARIAGYLHRTALGSAGDVVGRGTWKEPDNIIQYDSRVPNPNPPPQFLEYPWYDTAGGANEYAQTWNYTVEMEREIGSYDKTDPTQDTLLGLFAPHPGE